MTQNRLQDIDIEKKELEDYVEKLKTRYSTIDYVSSGSSLKFCLVAEGKAHLYPRLGPTMEWDTAAGQIIVEEADGAVIDTASGATFRYNKEDLLNNYFIAGISRVVESVIKDRTG